MVYFGHHWLLALFPNLPRFHSLFCVDNNIQKQKSYERQGRPGGVCLVNDVRSMQSVDVRGTSGEVLEPSQLDYELIQDLLNQLWAPPPYIHLAST